MIDSPATTCSRPPSLNPIRTWCYARHPHGSFSTPPNGLPPASIQSRYHVHLAKRSHNDKSRPSLLRLDTHLTLPSLHCDCAFDGILLQIRTAQSRDISSSPNALTVLLAPCHSPLVHAHSSQLRQSSPVIVITNRLTPVVNPPSPLSFNIAVSRNHETIPACRW